jgi:hypothetical protein
MGVVRVLKTWRMEVLVFMPHFVVAMPMDMVFIEQQDNATNHQDARGDQVGADCFL